MNRTKNTKKLDQTRRHHFRRLRFIAGLWDLAIHHHIKLLVLLGYLLTALWVWCNRGALLLPFSKGDIFETIFRGCFSLVILLMGGTLLVEIVIALGTPRGATKIQDDLAQAGFTNDAKLPPLLLFAYKGEGKRSWVYEFDPNNIPLSRWKSDQAEIGAALKRIITSVSQSKDGKRIILHTVPMCSALPDRVSWKDEYLSPDSFVLTLGEGMNGRETIDISTTPHLLLGGGTGSGKSWLLKCLLMQSLKKGASVIIADFKGGVDFSPDWHKLCKMIFDPQALLVVLTELTKELEHRRVLFREAKTSNIDEYNKATGADLRRYILACDEVAEIFDTPKRTKEEKEMYAQIEWSFDLIARQGRAFGLHLMLATQRPSADLIPKQVRSNLGLRICGRADRILSGIILDNPTAAEQVPLDAQGRFVTNFGQVFQGYLFDDSTLES